MVNHVDMKTTVKKKEICYIHRSQETVGVASHAGELLRDISG